jgi:sterol desaturase/sphingolipid hydroxylase (fatty acid hydroxylase superfamily)
LALSSLIDFVRAHAADFWELQAWATGVFFGCCMAEGLLARPRPPLKPSPDIVTDMVYWLLSPTIRVLVRVVSGGLLLGLPLLLGVESAPDVMRGFGPIAAQPAWLILIEMVLLMDMVTYWTHRAFHHFPLLWRFHAIHHSATTVRWSTTGRVHPFNDLVNYVTAILPFALLGFPIAVALKLLPLVMFYALMAHSKLRMDFGPLRAILVSPRFHRWHHTHSTEGGNMNFANVFSLWDRMFGTYYLPEGKEPERFGLDDGPIAESYLAHLLYPFRKRPQVAAVEPGALAGVQRASVRPSAPAPASAAARAASAPSP